MCASVSLVSIKLGELVGRKRPAYGVRGPGSGMDIRWSWGLC